MRRATLVLASGLAAAATAGALLYGPRSSPPSSPVDAARTGTASIQAPPLETQAGNAEPIAPVTHTDGSTAAPDERRANSRVDNRRRKRQLQDEDTVRAQIKESATQVIRDTYALLLEDLDLPPEEDKALVALLIEMQIEGRSASTSTGEIRGRTISQEERHERLAAAIGDEGLLEFLALEKDGQAYWETQQIMSLLRNRDVPLTRKQRDGMLEILVEVRARYPSTPPPAELDPRSLEYFEHTLAQLDEFDRHVVELAPSVLSPMQVVHLFNAYQRMSLDRVDDLELVRRMRAEQPGFAGSFYRARWSPYVIAR